METTLKPHVQVRGEFCLETRPKSCGVIIFGASGDLTARKLIPSLFTVYCRKLLPKKFFVLGAARSPMSDESFRDAMRDGLMQHVKNPDPDQMREFLRHCHYHAGHYTEPDLYQEIAGRLRELDQKFETGARHLFYLATPPSLYAPIVEQLGEAGLVSQTEEEDGDWARVIIEKPFGHDLASALALDRQLRKNLAEDQIYRIDHYLGKETVQNILMFRFANSIFEPIWNGQFVDHVKITVAESIGVGHRAGYFEQAGVIRDMFQNHMLQMLALVAMEPPASFDADRVRDEKVKLLRAIRPFDFEKLDEVFIRGQYVSGEQDGEQVTGYREEEGVAPNSHIETYAAVKLQVDNWRWQGVPIYMRSGKRLARRYSEIAITFKHIPHSMFSPLKPAEFHPNVLVLNVQPNEGIALIMQAKSPGPKLCMSTLKMDFHFHDVFDEKPGDAYERLLLDGMLGDQTLFVRHDDMVVAWSLITPILEKWEAEGSYGRVYPYKPGSWGPKEADELLDREGRYWINPV